ncbi:hypothetical protein TNCV_1944141 [Trichonephila clavipes]|nr:hypothetical protein TNCV_1944141 [Trichonephila clavipes]
MPHQHSKLPINTHSLEDPLLRRDGEEVKEQAQKREKKNIEYLSFRYRSQGRVKKGAGILRDFLISRIKKPLLFLIHIPPFQNPGRGLWSKVSSRLSICPCASSV